MSTANTPCFYLFVFILHMSAFNTAFLPAFRLKTLPSKYAKLKRNITGRKQRCVSSLALISQRQLIPSLLLIGLLGQNKG